MIQDGLENMIIREEDIKKLSTFGFRRKDETEEAAEKETKNQAQRNPQPSKRSATA